MINLNNEFTDIPHKNCIKQLDWERLREERDNLKIQVGVLGEALSRYMSHWTVYDPRVKEIVDNALLTSNEFIKNYKSRIISDLFKQIDDACYLARTDKLSLKSAYHDMGITECRIKILELKEKVLTELKG